MQIQVLSTIFHYLSKRFVRCHSSSTLHYQGRYTLRIFSGLGVSGKTWDCKTRAEANKWDRPCIYCIFPDFAKHGTYVPRRRRHHLHLHLHLSTACMPLVTYSRRKFPLCEQDGILSMCFKESRISGKLGTPPKSS